MTRQLLTGTALALCAIVLPDLAAAQDLAPVNNMATTVRDFLTGAFARTAGAIAIAIVGYRWFSGKMELGKALTIAGGIILVLGAVSIVDFVDQGIN